MLGDLEGVEHHLTRGIKAVQSIDLWSASGRDLALRLLWPEGVTILRFDDH
jgi:hypothetical protein